MLVDIYAGLDHSNGQTHTNPDLLRHDFFFFSSYVLRSQIKQRSLDSAMIRVLLMEIMKKIMAKN